MGHFSCSTLGSKIGHHGAVRRKRREATMLTRGHFATWKKKRIRQSSYQKGSPLTVLAPIVTHTQFLQTITLPDQTYRSWEWKNVSPKMKCCDIRTYSLKQYHKECMLEQCGEDACFPSSKRVWSTMVTFLSFDLHSRASKQNSFGTYSYL